MLLHSSLKWMSLLNAFLQHFAKLAFATSLVVLITTGCGVQGTEVGNGCSAECPSGNKSARKDASPSGDYDDTQNSVSADEQFSKNEIQDEAAPTAAEDLITIDAFVDGLVNSEPENSESAVDQSGSDSEAPQNGAPNAVSNAIDRLDARSTDLETPWLTHLRKPCSPFARAKLGQWTSESSVELKLEVVALDSETSNEEPTLGSGRRVLEQGSSIISRIVDNETEGFESIVACQYLVLSPSFIEAQFAAIEGYEDGTWRAVGIEHNDLTYYFIFMEMNELPITEIFVYDALLNEKLDTFSMSTE